MKCINCDTEIASQQQFCTKCGTKIDETFSEFTRVLERAEAGDAKSQGIIGKQYFDGSSTVTKNYAKAKKWFDYAAEQNDPIGLYGVGIFFLYGFNHSTIDYKKAFEYADRSAKLGCVHGMRLMGHLYNDGAGVAQSYDEARRLYHLAADQGDAAAQNCLGIIYRDGNGVQKNNEEAYRWFRLSADKGYPPGETNIGFMYATGTGVQINEVEALRWIRMAADHGDDNAQCALGLSYKFGTGVQKNARESYNWFMKAAAQGSARAYCLLAEMYENGIDIQMDIARAAELYTKAAEADTDFLDQRAWFYKKRGNLEKAVQDWYTFHKDHEPEVRTESEIKEWTDIINRHFETQMISQMKVADQRFIYYSPCVTIWDFREEESLYNGTSYTHRYGTDGTGYFAITDKGIYLCAFQYLTSKYRGVKNSFISSFLGRTTNHYKPINSDYTNFYAHNSIQSVSIDAGGSITIKPGNTICIAPYYKEDDQVINVSISCARSGLLIPSKTASASTDYDVVSRLKKLKELMEAGILSETEYNQKKSQMLAEIGL